MTVKTNKGSGRLVYPDDPIDADADEILEVWDDMTDAAGSFFGVVLADGEVLQFRWEECGRILIDIPKPSLGGSLQQSATRSYCRRLLSEASAANELPEIQDLLFQSW